MKTMTPQSYVNYQKYEKLKKILPNCETQKDYLKCILEAREKYQV